MTSTEISKGSFSILLLAMMDILNDEGIPPSFEVKED
jgi:hypothetical protein